MAANLRMALIGLPLPTEHGGENFSGWAGTTETMNTFKKIELGLEGLEYIKERLKLGHSLAKYLLLTHDMANGQISTIVPANIDDAAAKDFESGGKLPSVFSAKPNISRLEPVPNTDSFLVEEIKTFLHSGDRHVCLFEDASAAPTDPYLQNVESRILSIDQEVYYMLCRDDMSDKILKTIRLARSWLFIGVMASTSTDLCSGSPHITSDDLKLLAKGAEAIVIGAYDGEGYVTWTKR